MSLFALRLPFVLLGTATACLLRSVVGDVTGDHRLARRAALLVQIVPVHFGLGLLVSPDSPLLERPESRPFDLQVNIFGRR